MTELKELLVEQLQDLLNAETQIVGALPKMVEAAHCSKLKEALAKHLTQTESHVERLKMSLEQLGESADSKTCKGMQGIIEEGKETIEDSDEHDEFGSDLALIAAAQKVEHYEISGYGSARCLAKQIGEREVAKLLTYTLGEEEAADHILNELAKPLLQQASSEQFGNGTKTPWGEPGETGANEGMKFNANTSQTQSKARAATVGGSSILKAKKRA
jgi:Mn-containing catalase